MSHWNTCLRAHCRDGRISVSEIIVIEEEIERAAKDNIMKKREKSLVEIREGIKKFNNISVEKAKIGDNEIDPKKL